MNQDIRLMDMLIESILLDQQDLSKEELKILHDNLVDLYEEDEIGDGRELEWNANRETKG